MVFLILIFFSVQVDPGCVQLVGPLFHSYGSSNYTPWPMFDIGYDFGTIQIDDMRLCPHVAQVMLVYLFLLCFDALLFSH